MENNQSKSISLSPEQKIGFVLLLVFGILTIALGFLQMRNTIYNPFVVRFEKDSNAQVFADDKILLQQLDTDNDKISDYDEFEFYKTSPYLPDTDSDGLDDKFEIDNGKDPLCPEGTVCEAEIYPEQKAEQPSELPAEAGNNQTDLLNQLGSLTQDGTVGIGNTGTGTVDLNGIVNNPALIRQLLLASGKITEEQLSKIDDTALLEMIKQTNLPAGTNP